MTQADWMRALAEHVTRMHAIAPDELLAIVFDIDGTIVDTRYVILHALLGYDRAHGTEHFRGLVAEDIDAHEAQIDELLTGFDLAERERADVATWYREHLREAFAAGHRPYQGVLGVIRWFQLQPHVRIAINTGRPDTMRGDTLTALNAIGRAHRVTFDADLLFMNRSGREEDVAAGKVEALRALDDAGYRVVAVVDNEPEMIAAMATVDAEAEILFLHADTIFRSRRTPTPRTVSGSTYGLGGLVDEAELGRRVELVWHGVNDRHNLQQFVGSAVRWAELDVRRDPAGRLVLRHDGFDETPWHRGEELLLARHVLEVLRWEGRSAKLDLKEAGDVLEDVLAIIEQLGFTDDDLWFNGSIETLGRRGSLRLRCEHPGAVVQAPIDFLVPLLLATPEFADEALGMFRRWGVDRVSLDWRTPGARDVLDTLEALGWAVNLYGVPDLESFLEAALLLPASVTADFNFPAWNYDGRGPAKGRRDAVAPLADAVAE